MSSGISKEELQSFHSIDRNLYARLVIVLGFDAIVAMRVMGLWLWMEEDLGYPSVIVHLMNAPDNLVQAFFDEALIIISVLQSAMPPSFPGVFTGLVIPRTYALLDEEINLDFFYVTRDYSLKKIMETTLQVCINALEDALLQAMDGMGLDDTARRAMGLNDNVRHGKQPDVWGTVDRYEEPVKPTEPMKEIWPGPFSIPIPYGQSQFSRPVDIPRQMPFFEMPFPGHYPPPDARFSPHFEFGESSNSCWNPPPMYEEFPLPTDDRTMFMTFSRGYPISEHELYNYFLRSYGDVIEDMQFEATNNGNQPLYAIVLFRSPFTVARILNGRDRVKFVIRGKHVWTRRYVPKR